MIAKPYRPNVAAVVLDEHGHLLACERNDRVGVWQIPQGGIDPGETAEEALARELEEEIGTNEVEVIGRLAELVRYEFPKDRAQGNYIGQEQIYFLVRLKPGARLCLDGSCGEFRSYEWVGTEEFFNRLSGFKAPAYRHAIEMLRETFPGLLHE